MQGLLKGNCIAIDPQFALPAQLKEAAFMDHNWVGKRDADGRPVAKGRVCIDPTHVVGGDSINADPMPAEWDRAYGSVPCTNITAILRAVIQHADENGFPLADGRFWKDDVSNAFGQMPFDIESVRRSAIALHITPEAYHAAQAQGTALPPVLYFFLLYCYFGWGGASYAFGVFTRALKQIIPQHLQGIFDMFVDDLMGFAHHTVAENDQRTAQAILRSLFGDNAVAPKSITPCTRADLLGWSVDLVTETIRPSDRGCRKLLWAFFLVPPISKKQNSKLPLAFCQLLSSLACHYSVALRAMCMFVQPLNALTAGTSKAPRKVTSVARFSIEVWRAVGCILVFNPASMARSIRELVPPKGTTPAYALVTDAGPLALGIGIFRVDIEDLDAANPARCICYTHFDLSSWNEALTKDPAYQNTREYCGAVAGQIYAHDMQQAGILPTGPLHLHWHGDNTSALAWIDKNRVSSAQTQRIFMAHTWVCLRTPIDIPWTTHKAGSTMGDIDALSRRNRLASLPSELRFDFLRPIQLHALFAAIDPSATPRHVADHHDSFMNIYQRVADLLD